MTWRRGNHIAVAAQESGVACDAVHRARRAAFPTSRSGKEREWRQRECLTSEIVNDTLAARRFRLLAPLAVLLALVALALAPGIIGIM